MQTPMKLVHLRIEEDLDAASRQRAAELGETFSEYVREGMRMRLKESVRKKLAGPNKPGRPPKPKGKT